MSAVPSCLSVHHAAAGYGGAPVWSDVDATFAPGSLTAIVGPNGAGKSTFVRALLGEIALSAGRIDRHGASPRDIGYLPQARVIDRSFPISVADFAGFGRWRARGAFRRSGGGDVDAALAAIGLGGMGARTIDQLSVGQFQRACFVRLMLQDARVIVLDEPLTSLDAPTIADLMALVGRWREEGRTVLIVLHDLGLVRAHCPRTLLLAHGRGVCDATEAVLTPQRTAWAYGPHA